MARLSAYRVPLNPFVRLSTGSYYCQCGSSESGVGSSLYLGILFGFQIFHEDHHGMLGNPRSCCVWNVLLRYLIDVSDQPGHTNQDARINEGVSGRGGHEVLAKHSYPFDNEKCFIGVLNESSIEKVRPWSIVNIWWKTGLEVGIDHLVWHDEQGNAPV